MAPPAIYQPSCSPCCQTACDFLRCRGLKCRCCAGPARTQFPQSYGNGPMTMAPHTHFNVPPYKDAVMGQSPAFANDQAIYSAQQAFSPTVGAENPSYPVVPYYGIDQQPSHYTYQPEPSTAYANWSTSCSPCFGQQDVVGTGDVAHSEGYEAQVSEQPHHAEVAKEESGTQTPTKDPEVSPVPKDQKAFETPQCRWDACSSQEKGQLRFAEDEEPIAYIPSKFKYKFDKNLLPKHASYEVMAFESNPGLQPQLIFPSQSTRVRPRGSRVRKSMFGIPQKTASNIISRTLSRRLKEKAEEEQKQIYEKMREEAKAKEVGWVKNFSCFLCTSPDYIAAEQFELKEQIKMLDEELEESENQHRIQAIKIFECHNTLEKERDEKCEMEQEYQEAVNELKRECDEVFEEKEAYEKSVYAVKGKVHNFVTRIAELKARIALSTDEEERKRDSDELAKLMKVFCHELADVLNSAPRHSMGEDATIQDMVDEPIVIPETPPAPQPEESPVPLQKKKKGKKKKGKKGDKAGKKGKKGTKGEKGGGKKGKGKKGLKGKKKKGKGAVLGLKSKRKSAIEKKDGGAEQTGEEVALKIETPAIAPDFLGGGEFDMQNFLSLPANRQAKALDDLLQITPSMQQLLTPSLSPRDMEFGIMGTANEYSSNYINTIADGEVRLILYPKNLEGEVDLAEALASGSGIDLEFLQGELELPKDILHLPFDSATLISQVDISEPKSQGVTLRVSPRRESPVIQIPTKGPPDPSLVRGFMTPATPKVSTPHEQPPQGDETSILSVVPSTPEKEAPTEIKNEISDSLSDEEPREISTEEPLKKSTPATPRTPPTPAVEAMGKSVVKKAGLVKKASPLIDTKKSAPQQETTPPKRQPSTPMTLRRVQSRIDSGIKKRESGTFTLPKKEPPQKAPSPPNVKRSGSTISGRAKKSEHHPAAEAAIAAATAAAAAATAAAAAATAAAVAGTTQGSDGTGRAASATFNKEGDAKASEDDSTTSIYAALATVGAHKAGSPD